MPVTPYLFFNGRCEEAVEFYKKALGAEVGMMMRFKESPDKPPPGMVPDGSEDKIMHFNPRLPNDTATLLLISSFIILLVALANGATIQVTIDLVIACSVAMFFIFHDARARNVNPWPYLVATTFLGSLGLLAYAVRRAGLPAREPASTYARPVHA